MLNSIGDNPKHTVPPTTDTGHRPGVRVEPCQSTTPLGPSRVTAAARWRALSASRWSGSDPDLRAEPPWLAAAGPCRPRFPTDTHP
jgi:hypothetical protein